MSEPKMIGDVRSLKNSVTNIGDDVEIVNEIVNKVLTSLGANNTPASSNENGNVHSKLNKILQSSATPAGIVKSVQRGSMYLPVGESGGASKTATLPTPVDTSKCMVNVICGGEYTVYYSNFQSNQITFTTNHWGSGGPTFNWEVIEFY